LQNMLARAEAKRGPNAPSVKVLKRQLEGITSGKQSQTANDKIRNYQIGLRGKSNSESKTQLPSEKSKPESNPESIAPTTEE
ncbi:MAG: hypothetical protein WAM53_00110, partial [Terrimicrobiaceae bacterium]